MKERRAAQNKQAAMAAQEDLLPEALPKQALMSAANPLEAEPEAESQAELVSDVDGDGVALEAAEDQDADAKPLKVVVEKSEKRPFKRVELEADDNPGQALRMAREQAGFSMEEIGALTKINERQLEAIESGDPSRLPPETFAKAFIKSYCRVLNMDPRPIIHAYGFTETKALLRTGPAAVDQQVRLESLEAQVSAGAQILSNARLEGKTGGRRSLVYGLVLAAFGLMAAFYVPVFLANRNGDGAAEQQASAPPVVQEPEPLPEGFDPNQMADAHGQPVEPDAMGGYPPASAAAEPAFPALAEAPGQAPSVPVPAAPVAVPTAPAAAPVIAQAPVPAPAVQAPTAQVPAKAAAAAPPLGTGQAVLRFAFTGQSWLTVWDGNNQVLVSQDNPAGSAVVLKGNGPFKVFVGKPKAVSLNANGNAVAIAESTPGGVARLVLR